MHFCLRLLVPLGIYVREEANLFQQFNDDFKIFDLVIRIFMFLFLLFVILGGQPSFRPLFVSLPGETERATE